MKFNFKWNKDNKPEMTAELTEQKVNAYQHKNPIKGLDDLVYLKAEDRLCPECGEWFKPTHKLQVCCSKYCSAKRHKKQQTQWNKKYRENHGIGALIPKKCVVCGEMFTPSHNRQTICSKECRMEQDRRFHRARSARKRAEKASKQPIVKTNEGRKEKSMLYGDPVILNNGKKYTPPIKTCPACGKIFVAKCNKQIFCCEECREAANKIVKQAEASGLVKEKETKLQKPVPTTKICAICGKEFVTTRNAAKYCSDECRAEQARRTARSWWKENGNKVHGKRGTYWTDQADIIIKLVESGVGNEVVAKYLKMTFGGK